MIEYYYGMGWNYPLASPMSPLWLIETARRSLRPGLKRLCVFSVTMSAIPGAG